ncbi:MAG TPA: 4-hydroxy-tetrahydrodipicolinate reductase [Stellaceae bacterium]|nr:4-hydroxy-tetrahydrodipicolinate reductase [Stellaceae bacterium]
MTGCRIGIMGCGGRMGKLLIAEVLATPGAVLAGGTTSSAAGRDLGEIAGLPPAGIVGTADAEAVIAASDVVIDFTAPAVAARHAILAASHGTALVIGTTGLDAAATSAIEAAAAAVAVIAAPNMSLGVNLLLGLVEQVARRLDAGYDIEIVETHHRHKVDAPSGTALGLGKAAAAGRGVELDAVAIRSRDGHTGPRPAGSIGFAALRGGDIVGDHTVMFAGEGERLELTHRAGDRRIYARGAVRAALWTMERPAGLYGMRDVLGL